MTLEDILTNRTRLSEDILAEVLETAAGYGVRIQRADVNDLIFPGNLQEVMNRVLAAERLSHAQLVAHIFTANPALLRLRELETLRELAQVANARIYIGFPKHVSPELNGVSGDHE